MRKTLSRLLLSVIIIFSFFTIVIKADETIKDGRPSKDGFLHVEGTDIVNDKNERVILRGVSTHGLTWYPQYINEELFKDISENWNCNLVRLAMYSEDYLVNKQENMDKIYEGVKAAVDADMYVMIDWHILNDNDPNINISAAKEFFEEVSNLYGDCPNVLYEICNEPNGDTTWEDICDYANIIIPLIRFNAPKSLIIVGTPNYDQDLESPMNNPLPYDDILYCFHFYTASHGQEFRNTVGKANLMGLPVFISECGISEASGDGKVDYDNAIEWFRFLHVKGISYAIWSLSNKEESASFIRADSTEFEHLEDEDLTHVGKWIRELLRGTAPRDIPIEGYEQNYNVWERIKILFINIGYNGLKPVRSWPYLASLAILLFALAMYIYLFQVRKKKGTIYSYDVLIDQEKKVKDKDYYLVVIMIGLSMFFTTVYLLWRIFYSIAYEAGVISIASNIILLVIEILGFFETCIHYSNAWGRNSHPLPEIKKNEYPEVDIFIASYNEPAELLYKTINGCKHLKYPNNDKVHIWLCDDNRRKEIKALCKKMKVGYFDRPDNEGAKAGNLNHALGLTSAPYIVTLDADMIVRSDFLLKTIPYFVDVEKRAKKLKEDVHLGFLQTPQCFYDPDVFQHALYAETRIPNEQDFFYRAIEVGKTSSNSVIYGGSNTILSRKALEDIGGFYTGSITEDFATGLLIESKGYLSLALGEPMASGKTPHTYKEHIKQRSRWGRGVISTGKKLHILTGKGLRLEQKLSYLSSVTYWYSSVKTLVYIMSPILFAVFNIRVFKCSWLDLLVYWFPMFVFQDLCLRVMSGNLVSSKWSGIYETSVMPHLLIPILKETFGLSESKFLVTDKTRRENRKVDYRSMVPFIILIFLSAVGIVRAVLLIRIDTILPMVIMLFWLLRNFYFLFMAIFLIDGRDSDNEEVKVRDGEFVNVECKDSDLKFEGITTFLTEHSMKVILDEGDSLKIGERLRIKVFKDEYEADLEGVVIDKLNSRFNNQCVHTLEILKFNNSRDEYLQILYDRIPTLPQTLNRDLGIAPYFWRNIIQRLALRNRM